MPPEAAIEPVVGEDGIVRNAAGTILGSDNKAAVVVMLEAVRRIVRENRPHAGIELVFTPQEEVSLRGAAAFDHTRLTRGRASSTTRARPSARSSSARRTAGCSTSASTAVPPMRAWLPRTAARPSRAAGRAIADFRLGRIDDETSANIGVISGGTARNVVPEWCSFTAEVRSHDERKASELVREMLETAAFAASLAECEVESEVRPSFPGYRFRESDEPVHLAATALRAAGFEPTLRALRRRRGRERLQRARALVREPRERDDGHPHPDERIAVADLDAMVEVTLALVDAARG